MTVQVQQAQVGQPFTQNGGLTLDAAEYMQRITDAILALQESPVFANGKGPILTSPDGTQYRLEVDNAGNLSTSAV